jgi:hypothetical protein
MSESSTRPPRESTCSAEASPARTSAPQESGPASTESVPASGESTHGWLAFYDPASSSWRTSQLCLGGVLESFSETFPRSGTMQSGRLFARPTWVRRTDESASSSWPTPDASVANDGESLESLESRREREKAKGQNGNGFGLPLAAAARMWPTATATATDAKASGAAGYSTASGRHSGVTLTDAAVRWPSPLAGGPSLPMAVRWTTPCARDDKSGRMVHSHNTRPLSEQAAGAGPATSATGRLVKPMICPECGVPLVPFGGEDICLEYCDTCGGHDCDCYRSDDDYDDNEETLES